MRRFVLSKARAVSEGPRLQYWCRARRMRTISHHNRHLKLISGAKPRRTRPEIKISAESKGSEAVTSLNSPGLRMNAKPATGCCGRMHQMIYHAPLVSCSSRVVCEGFQKCARPLTGSHTADSWQSQPCIYSTTSTIDAQSNLQHRRQALHQFTGSQADGVV